MITYNDLRPRNQDNKNALLGKILTVLGGSPENSDNESALLGKILLAAQGGAGQQAAALAMSQTLTDRNDTTALVARRLEGQDNVRVLVFGDSIAASPLFGDYYGALRVLQEHIGNAGAGGYNVNAEAFPVYGGGTVGATANWFRTYHSVPASGWVEFSGNSQSRRLCDTIKIAWRAPVGGTATFKIQTCTDLDGAGVGTWVDQGGTRTAVASGAAEEVGGATISITEGLYRIRVLGVSGTTNIFSMEMSHSTVGGAVINNHAEGGSAFSTWADLTDLQRKTFVDQIDPDVIFVMYKDSGPTMTADLAKLATTLEQSLSGSYPRDVVILPPFPSIPDDSIWWSVAETQRDAMRVWAADNRAAYIDLWNLMSTAAAYYNADGIHLAGADEGALIGSFIISRLGWLDYPKVKASTNAVIRTARRTAYVQLPDSTTYAEDTNFRIPVGIGEWRITGKFLFSDDGTAGEGGKIRITHTGNGSVMNMFNYKRWGVNGSPQVACWPYFGAVLSLPLEMNGCTPFSFCYGYDLDQLELTVFSPGFITVHVAKEATGGAIYFREGSYVRAEKLPR